jgi:hypothetical protein
MLLFFEKPFKDETLGSFTYRTAKKNLMTNLNWIFENFQRYSSIQLKENEINWLNKEALNQLSPFLRVPPDTLYHLTITQLLEKDTFSYRNFRKNKWFLYSKVRVCPLCIKEKAYQRKSWSSSFLSVCTTHNLLLIDLCKNCGTSFTTKSIILNTCHRCEHPLSSFESKDIINKELLSFQNVVVNRISNGEFYYKHKWIKDFSTFLTALEFIGLWAVQLLEVQDFVFKELNINYDGKALERHSLKNAKSVEQALCIYYYSFRILNEWPSAFHRFLEKAEFIKKTNFNSYINNVIPKLANTSLEPICREVNGYYFKKHFDLKGVQKGEFIRSDEIKSLNSKFNASIVKEGYFQTYPIVEKDYQFDLINLNEFKEWLMQYEDSLTKQDLIERWKFSSKAATQILNSNLLNPSFNYKGGSVSSWVVPTSPLEVFESKLMSLRVDNLTGLVLLNKAIEWFGPENTSIIFEGMLDKSIRFQSHSGSIADIQLSRNDIYNYGRRRIIAEGERIGFITFRDITFLLGVKKLDIIYWIQTDRFGKMSGNIAQTVPIDNFLLFQKQYLTTLELSYLTDMPIKVILKKVNIGNIPVISGPKKNDGKRILFDKTSIIEPLCKRKNQQ